MSTNLYLLCLDHRPPLRCSEASGQHLSDLPQIRDWIRRRRELVAEYEADFAPWQGGIGVTAGFLADHQLCRIGLVDEYGERHSTDDDFEVKLPDGSVVRATLLGA